MNIGRCLGTVRDVTELGEEHERTVVVVGGQPVEAVLGYRAWTAVSRDGRCSLSSMYHGCAWHPGAPQVARARGGRDRLFGIYAFRYRASLVRRIPWLTVDHSRMTDGVVGEAAMWGWVCAHEDGYRAEYAVPTALYVAPSMSDKARLLAELAAARYELPIVRVDREETSTLRTHENESVAPRGHEFAASDGAVA